MRSDKHLSFITGTCIPKHAVNVTQAEKAPFQDEYTFDFANKYFCNTCMFCLFIVEQYCAKIVLFLGKAPNLAQSLLM